jgi:hypothetical protein
MADASDDQRDEAEARLKVITAAYAFVREARKRHAEHAA